MITRCLLPEAKRIGALPKAAWSEEVAKLPAVCPHADCSQGASCREVVREYLRVQWRTTK